ncbi:RDD family protein [Paenalkalicoccus suaedae]|uniref:RDD family protein n=1 Tax=Paenalkalicoccus suaedae TaxID=2592382 RepID=A0A859FGY4_9BACI|nr:RDD family protein [Paenalkalicoccus suaedae]QKS72060.1 RDD family protein [Paenalkalicoccus suaedae]
MATKLKYEGESLAYAGFWMRFWAYFVDIILTSSLTGAVIALVFGQSEWSFGVITLSGLIGAIITYGYFVILTKLFQQTLGKQLFGIIVLSNEKRELSWLDVLFREVIGRFIYRSLVFTNLLYLIVPFQREKRGIHDFIGNTYVALEPRKKRVVTPVEEVTAYPVTPEVSS